MIINELEGNFGKATEDEKQWIAVNLEKLDYDLQTKFLTELHKIHKEGFPDISIMKNLLVRITGKRPKEYIWAVCLECGCEYDYGLPMCPACYENGLDCRAKAVKKSEFQPPMKVIKYNKQSNIKYQQKNHGIHNSQNSHCLSNSNSCRKTGISAINATNMVI